MVSPACWFPWLDLQGQRAHPVSPEMTKKIHSSISAHAATEEHRYRPAHRRGTSKGCPSPETLTAVRTALAKEKTFIGWTLRETTTRDSFSRRRQCRKDLLDHETEILDPIVRALATSDPSQQSPEFQFDPIGPADIDQLAPPELTPLVLDADSSQRAAVAAALESGPS